MCLQTQMADRQFSISFLRLRFSGSGNFDGCRPWRRILKPGLIAVIFAMGSNVFIYHIYIRSVLPLCGGLLIVIGTYRA